MPTAKKTKSTPAQPKKKKVSKLSRFGEFLKEHEIDRDTMAAGLEVSGSYISMMAHGKASPGFRLAKKISEWTKKNAPEAFPLEAW